MVTSYFAYNDFTHKTYITLLNMLLNIKLDQIKSKVVYISCTPTCCHYTETDWKINKTIYLTICMSLFFHFFHSTHLAAEQTELSIIKHLTEIIK